MLNHNQKGRGQDAAHYCSNLKDLEASFGRMIVRVKRHLDMCDLSEAKLFLHSAIGTNAFSECENFGELLEKLHQDHIDVFNIFILVACFNNNELTEEIEAYNERKESFFKQTTVLEFQRAVVSRVESILSSGMAVVTITISKQMASHRTLKDIEKLAMGGFKEYHKRFIRLHAEICSSTELSGSKPKLSKQGTCNLCAVEGANR